MNEILYSIFQIFDRFQKDRKLQKFVYFFVNLYKPITPLGKTNWIDLCYILVTFPETC